METNPAVHTVIATNGADGKSALTEMKPWPPFIQVVTFIRNFYAHVMIHYVKLFVVTHF